VKVLVVKMSSMGDVVHTLPAVTDAARRIPGVQMDWVVEEGFVQIPKMHPGVNDVIGIALRRWRRSVSGARPELSGFLHRVRRERYDLIIDAQGLFKSAAVALLARGPRTGFDWHAAREPIASLSYDRRVSVESGIHAIDKVRRLFAVALNYDLPQTAVDYGLGPHEATQGPPQVMFLHGTTWSSKHWPERFWLDLATRAVREGLRVVVPHGNDEELARARRIGAVDPSVVVMDRVGLDGLARELRRTAGVVAVDSGLGHLAAALDVPVVALFGPTDPVLTGPRGKQGTVLVSDHLPCIPCFRKTCRFPLETEAVYPPCFSDATPARVWDELLARIDLGQRASRS